MSYWYFPEFNPLQASLPVEILPHGCSNTKVHGRGLNISHQDLTLSTFSNEQHLPSFPGHFCFLHSTWQVVTALVVGVT